MPAIIPYGSGSPRAVLAAHSLESRSHPRIVGGVPYKSSGATSAELVRVGGTAADRVKLVSRVQSKGLRDTLKVYQVRRQEQQSTTKTCVNDQQVTLNKALPVG